MIPAGVCVCVCVCVCARVCLSSHHSPLPGVVEPLQQLDGGALPTAAATHQSQSLSLFHLQIQPLEDGNIRP